MNICLERKRFGIHGTAYPPMGLLTLAAYLDQKHTAILRDRVTLPVDGDGRIYDFDVRLISAFSFQLPYIESELQLTQKNFPETRAQTKVVVGGPAVTCDPEYASKVCPSADLLVAGEGEYLAENIEHLLVDGKKLVDYRSDPYLLECKKLPRWDLVENIQRYVDTVGFGVETSRGCPFNCVMCTAHMTHGKQWRPRKPDDVVNELATLKQQYGCSKFYFADDNATVNPSRWLELMQKIAAKNLGLSLSVPEGIQAHHLDRETLLAMKAAGLTHFTIGAESGNQRVLDNVICKGGLTVGKIEETVRLANSLGMKASCFFVIGFIGETLEEARQTVAFAEKLRHLGAERCTVRNAIPMPGTRLFEVAKIGGCLAVPEDKLFDFRYVHEAKHLLKTPDWNSQDIDKLVAKAKEQEFRHIFSSNIFVHPRAALRLLANHKA